MNNSAFYALKKKLDDEKQSSADFKVRAEEIIEALSKQIVALQSRLTIITIKKK